MTLIRLNSGRLVSPARHYEIWRAKKSAGSAMDTIRAIAAHPNNSPEFQAELDRVIAEADKQIEEFNQWRADLERRLNLSLDIDIEKANENGLNPNN